MFDRQLFQMGGAMKCPVCGSGCEVLCDHLIREHGVNYNPVFDGIPERLPDITWLAPCGATFDGQEACDRHILEHGAQCILEHFLLWR